MNPPANWYPDPTQRHGQRYWDGEQWTEHVFSNGVQATDPLDAPSPHAQAATTDVEEVEDDLFTPVAEQPAAEQPAAEQPAAEQPAAEQPAAEQPAAEQPAAELPSALEDESSVDDGPVATADAPAPTIDERSDGPPPMQPPGSATGPTHGGRLGITGDLVGGAFSERDSGPVALQNTRLLRCTVTPETAIVARQGTMVAYQGEVSFDRQGAGGVGRALKRAATGEGLAMMRVEGTGDVFFADAAQHVFLLHLHGGPGLSVNGRNVLAFSASLAWDIEGVTGASLLAGGLFNTTLTGTGWVALVSDGEPVVLGTDDAPTYVDVNALVAWSGGLSTRVVNTVTAKSLIGLGSGEAFQMAFDGAGIVIVQPSEGAMGGAAAAAT